ncbi:MAG: nitroreductase family protein, partial [Thermoplasmata archaeon]|nr:nitroreductase family protein [Thermoplasmata archaeon]
MIRYAKKLSRVLLSPLMALNRSLVVSGLICYMQELAFHRRAKNLLLASQGNKALLIRKYTHFLERFLFQPSAYEDGFGERVAAQLETFLENAGEGLQSDQQKWAKKILEEFYAGADHEVRCPLLIKGAKRSNPSMDTDNLMKLIRSRRSRRIFNDMPLTEEERDKITEAAQWTPSTCNRQSLHLIFIEDPELKSFVASTVPGGHQFFPNAPCIIIMVADVSDYRFPSDRVNPFMEAGAAVQNIY